MTSIEQVQEFLTQCVKELGLGFHPDTNFNEYYYPNGRKFYTSRRAATLNGKMVLAFCICKKYNADIYELTMDLPEYQALMNNITE